MRAYVKALTPNEFTAEYPIDHGVAGWRFQYTETSPCAYLVEGHDRFGRVVSRHGDDPEVLLDACADDARAVQRQLTSFADNQELYASVALLGFDMTAAEFPGLGARLREAMAAGSTAGEVLGALRQELLSTQVLVASSQADIRSRVDLFIRVIDTALGARERA